MVKGEPGFAIRLMFEGRESSCSALRTGLTVWTESEQVTLGKPYFFEYRPLFLLVREIGPEFENGIEDWKIEQLPTVRERATDRRTYNIRRITNDALFVHESIDNVPLNFLRKFGFRYQSLRSVRTFLSSTAHRILFLRIARGCTAAYSHCNLIDFLFHFIV